MAGATWTSNHEYGSIMINHIDKLYYIHIPKCASSWTKKYLNKSSSWHYDNFTTADISGYRAIIILRDPVERWISAAPGIDRMTEPYFIKTLPQEFNRLKSWMHDEHSAPQTDFISGVNLDNAIFFYCDNNLASNINHFLDTKIELEPQNVQPINLKYKLSAETWQFYFNNEVYLNKFKQAYKKDYDLINQVKFYDPR